MAGQQRTKQDHAGRHRDRTDEQTEACKSSHEAAAPITTPITGICAVYWSIGAYGEHRYLYTIFSFNACSIILCSSVSYVSTAPVMDKDACVVTSRHNDVSGRVRIRYRVYIILMAQRCQHSAARGKIVHNHTGLGGRCSHF